jgi:hypothetical protein
MATSSLYYYYLTVFDYSAGTLGAANRFETTSTSDKNYVGCGIAHYADNRFILAYIDSSTPEYANVAVCEVSGTDVTIGTLYATSAAPYRSIYAYNLRVSPIGFSDIAVIYMSGNVEHIDYFKVSDMSLTLNKSIKPFSTGTPASQVASPIAMVGSRAVAFTNESGGYPIYGKSTEAVVIDFNIKVTPSNGVIEGITRTKVYNTVKGEVWTLSKEAF